MLNNWDKSFELVIKSEGGFTNDQNDPGNRMPDGRQGCTIWGCTQKTWEAYVGHQVTQDDIRKLTKEDVKPLYKKEYWDKVSGDSLPVGIDYLLFDFGINAGPKTSVKTLQKALKLSDDGVLGPNTMLAVKTADPIALAKKFGSEKIHHYENLPTYPRYGKGWLARVAQVEKVAIEMIGA